MAKPKYLLKFIWRVKRAAFRQIVSIVFFISLTDYENQITNESSPNERQNPSNKGIVPKESVQTKTLKKLVHDWFEEKTCGTEEMVLTSGKTELQGSSSESMDLEKEGSHHSHAKKERKKKSKTNVQSREKTEKRLEEQASLEDKSKFSIFQYTVDEKATTRYKIKAFVPP